MFVLFLKLGPRVHRSRDEPRAGGPSFHGGPLGGSEEVRTIHNEKASTFHETLEVGVKDADIEQEVNL